MIKRQNGEVQVRDQTAIYIIRGGEELGPYTREELKDDVSITASSLIKIGTNGKPFPAGMLKSDWATD